MIERGTFFLFALTDGNIVLHTYPKVMTCPLKKLFNKLTVCNNSTYFMLKCRYNSCTLV